MRRGGILKLLVRGAVGFLLGFAIWAGLTLPYNRLLAASAEVLINATEKPDRTELRLKGKEILVYRSDVPPGSSRPGIPVYDLTFNVILLSVLFAVDPRPLSSRNVGRFAISLLILVPTHVAGLVAWIQDLYASHFGPISEKGYSNFERSFWQNALFFYRLVGQFAIPLILRWSLASERYVTGEPDSPGDARRRARHHPARRRR